MRSLSRLYQFGRRFSWVNYGGTFIHNHNWLHASCLYSKISYGSCFQNLSANTQQEFPWESSSFAALLRKLEVTLESDSLDEAWEAFNNYRRLHGFPKQQLVSRMITCLSCSSSPHWLRKAYNLVLVVVGERPSLLHHDSLARLALTLARAQMPVPASTILRTIFEKYKSPTTDIWNTLFFHLVKTQIGSYLACEILVEICNCYIRYNSGTKSSKQMTLKSPDTTIFNLVLESCLRFGSTLKAQQIIELMSHAGAVADANSIIIIARIYEIIGQRNELRKLKGHIDGVSSVFLNHYYRQFYDSLLSLHFKYNDLDAASELVLDLYQRPKPLPSSNGLFTKNNGVRKPCLVQIGSSNLKNGYKIMVEPEKLQNDFVVDAQSHCGLVLCTEGKLVPSNKAFAKLINGYVKERKVGKLSNLLINIQKEMDSKEANLSSDVMNACIQLGWLETAHDILDDLEASSIPISIGTYMSLLRAYCKENMFEESKVLLKQMRKMGPFVNLSDEDTITSCLCGDGTIDPLNTKTVASDGKSHLAAMLDSEMGVEDPACPDIYEFNSTILFFCKAKMMDDALNTFKRMQQRNIQPTVQTFSYLVNGFSSMKMYRQITILWGEIKRRYENGVLTADRDLFDCLLWNFVRGGYFERVLEIVNYMIKHNMYIDKWKYKREFLKLHKDLYRSLKASDARTDAQSKRLEHVQSFRRWVGINQKS